jgi:hypothetical protein
MKRIGISVVGQNAGRVVDDEARRMKAWLNKLLRRAPIGFAPDDRIQALHPFIDEFWERVLGTSMSTSFVSNQSRFSSWEHYVGGREQLIERVQEQYWVDISAFYDDPIPDVLTRIRDAST